MFRTVCSTSKSILSWSIFLCIVSTSLSQNRPDNKYSASGSTGSYKPHLEFDVASIHLARDKDTSYITNELNSSVYIASGVTLWGLILRAYNLQIGNLLENAPSWTTTTRYDLSAKSDTETDEYLAHLSETDSFAEKNHMLQQLLAERFNLKIHPEKRLSTTYQLVTTERTARFLIPVQGEVAKTVSSCAPVSYSAKGRVVDAKGCPFWILLSQLQQQVGTDIVDLTGLDGSYAYHLAWNPDPETSLSGGDQYPNIKDAVREQLGLELKPTKALVTFWIIDHIEHPTPN